MAVDGSNLYNMAVPAVTILTAAGAITVYFDSDCACEAQREGKKFQTIVKVDALTASVDSKFTSLMDALAKKESLDRIW